MNVGKRIQERREAIGLTVDEMADALGKDRSTIYRYERGDIEKLPTSVLEPLAKILDTTPSYLMGWDDNEYIEPNLTNDYTTYPVIGDIAAGYDKICLEDWNGETIDVPNSYLKGNKKTDFFVLCVKGDSMFPTYQDGDKVLILKQSTLNYSGQIGAVIYGDEYATLKKVEYNQGEDWMKLVPVNPLYKPVDITNEELEHCRVIGIPKLLIRDIEN